MLVNTDAGPGSDDAGAGEQGGDIIALADPGPGLSADKGGAIATRLEGLGADEALFVDDSSGNIVSASPHCDVRARPSTLAAS